MKLSKLLTVSGMVILCGCGAENQDDGQGEAIVTAQTNIDITGIVVDGYLARATVFHDINNNGTRDSFEPSAFTDNGGYYSFNPLTNTNYCADTASADQSVFCLQISSSNTSDVIIRIDSGYDLLTGEPFFGQLSRRLTQDELNTQAIISPITSLISGITDEQETSAVLAALSLSEQDVEVDYLDSESGINEALLNTALKIHKTITVLDNRLTDIYDELGENVGIPNDATALLYDAVAQQLITQQINSSDQDLDTLLLDSDGLNIILNSVETQIREIYEREEYTLPGDLNNQDYSVVVNTTPQISALVDRLIAPDTDYSNEYITGSVRAVETLLLKSFDAGSQAQVDELNDAFAFFNSGEQDSLVEDLIDALAQDNADISSLAMNDFQFEGAQDVTESATLPEGAQALSGLGGNQLKVSDLDLGRAPNDLEDKELILFFNGQPEDISGSFDICVKFIDDANINGTLGELNTRGELATGFWSLLGATEENPQTFSLLLTIDFLGSTFQAIMKPAGNETIDDINYDVVRFDYDGDIEQWHSEEGIQSTAFLPTSNQDCADLLPSRIGL